MDLSNEQLICEAVECNHAGVGSSTLERYRGHLVHFAHLASVHQRDRDDPAPLRAYEVGSSAGGTGRDAGDLGACRPGREELNPAAKGYGFASGSAPL